MFNFSKEIVMRERLFFMFPDIGHTREVVNELLLKRIDIGHMHILAKDGLALGDLPSASLWQKSDVSHAGFVGIIAGGATGAVCSMVAYNVLDVALGSAILGFTLLGVCFGVWVSTMIGVGLPNSQLQKYTKSISDGELLLMVDVPKNQVHEVEALVEKTHPEAKFGGIQDLQFFP
jgi:hypothetical protein